MTFSTGSSETGAEVGAAALVALEMDVGALLDTAEEMTVEAAAVEALVEGLRTLERPESRPPRRPDLAVEEAAGDDTAGVAADDGAKLSELSLSLPPPSLPAVGAEAEPELLLLPAPPAALLETAGVEAAAAGRDNPRVGWSSPPALLCLATSCILLCCWCAHLWSCCCSAARTTLGTRARAARRRTRRCRRRPARIAEVGACMVMLDGAVRGC